jgi:outer membrane immunogenic protein
MKKLLLSATALIGLTAGAMAADLPSRRAAPPPVIAAVPIFTWTGFYIGVNAGAGFNTNDNDRSVVVPGGPAAGTTVTFSSNDDAGFVGGGQIGYNYQFGQFVVGLETDIQWADLGGNNVGIVTGGPAGSGFVAASRGNGIDWFGTVRGRAGVAFDRLLIYATGGFAYGSGDNGNDFFNNDDDIRTGWVVGGGVEWALPTSWNFFGTSAATFGVEGLFVSLDRSHSDVVGFVGAEPVTVLGGDDDNNNEFAVVRAKLNFKF